MDRINARNQILQKFGGSRKVATAHAKAAVVRSDIQSRLEEMGGFVWKVEMWPNWLQIWVDSTGNNDDDHRKTGKVADDWAERNKERLQASFADLLGNQFGELAIIGSAMGNTSLAGGCCRTGCGGCLNGAHDKLLSKLKGAEGPGDRVG
ncbi:MAG: hypothetical protein KF760_29715 [Candidatus Eremiobacteraeota bacterium]|nr:hypothetical protein [Candidatus Eremiobacteraeota bacterium]MCW5870580.1 hypothetical protein [Candidatus Eremiobacteraeota bacterium]